ncbi:MAG: hypothetical protein AAF748_11320 [Pseudomonadota bacterium]
MKAVTKLQEAQQDNVVLDAVRSTIRMLLAAYVLAAATAISIDDTLPLPMGGLFGAEATPFAAAALFAAGGALLLGIKVLAAGSLLALYLILSGLAHAGLTWVAPTPGAVAADLTLLATVLLIMMLEANAQRSGGVSPRRVRPLPAGPMAEPPASRRLDRTSEQLARDAVETIAKREAQNQAEAVQSVADSTPAVKTASEAA